MDAKKLILETINEHNGEWSWYKIDRILGSKVVKMGSQCLETLHLMEQEGLIETKTEKDVPYPPYYITEKGLKYLCTWQKCENEP